MADIIAAREKLAARFNNVRTGGKGTIRRKKKVQHKTATADDKKITTVLKKLDMEPIQGVEEVNFFLNNSRVLHFADPKVTANISANTYCISGIGASKNLQELLPGIISQLGPENLSAVQKLAENMQAAQMAKNGGGATIEEAGSDEEDMPELVENFEAVSEQD